MPNGVDWINSLSLPRTLFTTTSTYQSEHTSQSSNPYWSYQLHPQSCWPWIYKKKRERERKKKSAECMCCLFAPHNVIRQATLSAWEKQERRSSLLAATVVFRSHAHSHTCHHTHICMIASFVLSSCMHPHLYKVIRRLCTREIDAFLTLYHQHCGPRSNTMN